MKVTPVKFCLILIIASAFTWQCIGAWQDSQTTDEAVHLVAGRSYWQTGNFSINPEHPSLFKLWSSLPLALLPHSQIQTSTNTWKTRNEWIIAAEYLYTGPAQAFYNGRFLLFLGRWQMMLIWLGLIITMASTSWRRWGPWTSVAVTTLIAYDPNFLGHGHLVTNDVAMAFAYLGTFLALDWFTSKPRWSRLAIFSTVFALAQLTKFSAVILWLFIPLVMAIAILYRRPIMTWRWWWRSILACIIVTSIATWASYDFQFTRITSDPTIAHLWQERAKIVNTDGLLSVPAYTRLFVRLSNPSSMTGQLMDTVQHWSVPTYWYWRGLFSDASHNAYGHSGFLLGHASTQGWWDYFPVAIAVKAPLLLLLSVLAGTIVLLIESMRNRRRPWRQRYPFTFWIFGFPPLAFLAWSMTSHINIGVRHVFPVYVFLPFTIVAVLRYLQHYRPKLVPAIALSVSIITVIVATSAWPNTIGYYNALAGGTNDGHRIVLDSNLDWNQDIWRLKNFLHQQQFSDIHIALFGSIPTPTLFPNALPILNDQQIHDGLRPTGIVIISAGILYDVHGSLTWYRTQPARWRIGSSMYIYDYR